MGLKTRRYYAADDDCRKKCTTLEGPQINMAVGEPRDEEVRLREFLQIRQDA